MKFISNKKKHTGIAVHLTSILSKNSCGCGEFEDLIPLSNWCKDNGLSIIQILPIHDTGENPSPYSAQSAFALNPVFIRLISLNGYEKWENEIEMFKEKSENLKRIPYEEVYRFKIHILKNIFIENHDSLNEDTRFQEWIKKNKEWLDPYCTYKTMLVSEGFPQNWDKDPVFFDNHIQDNLENFKIKNKENFLFYSFVQYELENQLLLAVSKINENQVNLKGDMPILMDRESCDVWFHKEIFNTSFCAGAPPDQFSERGQNWGFPVYNIEYLKKTGFHWWKSRMNRLGLFFNSLRLDHVIGYMRIWQTNRKNPNAAGGYFFPARYFSNKELLKAGLTLEDINFLSRPSLFRDSLFKNFSKEKADKIFNEYLEELNGSCFTISEKIVYEKDIENLQEDNVIKDFLKDFFQKKTFNIIEQKGFAPLWYFDRSDYFQTLDNEKKEIINSLVKSYFKESEKIWFDNGMDFLGALEDSSDFLLCGEDLGAVPSNTPELLLKLNILSLKVLRWTRRYNDPGEPFILPEEYPEDTVATTSVHDSDNLRQWWKDDTEAREILSQLIENDENSKEEILTIDLSKKLLKWFFTARSKLIIIPIQDFFSLDEKYRIEDPKKERINVPGEVLETNWNYKIPCKIEDFISDEKFSLKIKSLVEFRDSIPLDKAGI